MSSFYPFIIYKSHPTPNLEPINEWVERRRTEWDEHVTKMDVERIDKTPRDNIPAERRSPIRKENGAT